MTEKTNIPWPYVSYALQLRPTVSKSHVCTHLKNILKLCFCLKFDCSIVAASPLSFHSKRIQFNGGYNSFYGDP